MQATTTEPRQPMQPTHTPAAGLAAGDPLQRPKRRKAPRRPQRRTTGARQAFRCRYRLSLPWVALCAVAMAAAALMPPVPSLPPSAAVQSTHR